MAKKGRKRHHEEIEKLIDVQELTQEEQQEIVKIRATTNGINFVKINFPKGEVKEFEHAKLLEWIKEFPNIRHYMNCGVLEVVND